MSMARLAVAALQSVPVCVCVLASNGCDFVGGCKKYIFHQHKQLFVRRHGVKMFVGQSGFRTESQTVARAQMSG